MSDHDPNAPASPQEELPDTVAAPSPVPLSFAPAPLPVPAPSPVPLAWSPLVSPPAPEPEPLSPQAPAARLDDPYYANQPALPAEDPHRTAVSTANPKVIAPGTSVIDIIALEKRFGGVLAVRGLALSVRGGEVYGFLGRNGAGKSTTIRILMGITKPDRGEVRLFGEPLTKTPIALRQRIGYVAQEQSFYPWMTAARLGAFVGSFFPTWDRRYFETLCDAQAVPLGRKVGTFSGGMKMKLALALALGHRPPLLILDEPTAGLDPVARREFLERVREDAEQTGRTTFFSTHLIDEIELVADRVGIVDQGVTRYEGRVSDLAARMRLYRCAPDAPTLPAPLLALPASVRLHSDRVFRGERRLVFEGAADALRLLDAQMEARFETLPLEEIFIEMVRGSKQG